MSAVEVEPPWGTLFPGEDRNCVLLLDSVRRPRLNPFISVLNVGFDFNALSVLTEAALQGVYQQALSGARGKT